MEPADFPDDPSGLGPARALLLPRRRPPAARLDARLGAALDVPGAGRQSTDPAGGLLDEDSMLDLGALADGLAARAGGSADTRPGGTRPTGPRDEAPTERPGGHEPIRVPSEFAAFAQERISAAAANLPANARRVADALGQAIAAGRQAASGGRSATGAGLGAHNDRVIAAADAGLRTLTGRVVRREMASGNPDPNRVRLAANAALTLLGAAGLGAHSTLETARRCAPALRDAIARVQGAQQEARSGAAATGREQEARSGAAATGREQEARSAERATGTEETSAESGAAATGTEQDRTAQTADATGREAGATAAEAAGREDTGERPRFIRVQDDGGDGAAAAEASNAGQTSREDRDGDADDSGDRVTGAADPRDLTVPSRDGTRIVPIRERAEEDLYGTIADNAIVQHRPALTALLREYLPALSGTDSRQERRRLMNTYRDRLIGEVSFFRNALPRIDESLANDTRRRVLDAMFSAMAAERGAEADFFFAATTGKTIGGRVAELHAEAARANRLLGDQESGEDSAARPRDEAADIGNLLGVALGAEAQDSTAFDVERNLRIGDVSLDPETYQLLLIAMRAEPGTLRDTLGTITRASGTLETAQKVMLLDVARRAARLRGNADGFDAAAFRDEIGDVLGQRLGLLDRRRIGNDRQVRRIGEDVGDAFGVLAEAGAVARLLRRGARGAVSEAGERGPIRVPSDFADFADGLIREAAANLPANARQEMAAEDPDPNRLRLAANAALTLLGAAGLVRPWPFSNPLQHRAADAIAFRPDTATIGE